MQREREDEREPAFFEMGEKGGEENEREKEGERIEQTSEGVDHGSTRRHDWGILAVR